MICHSAPQCVSFVLYTTPFDAVRATTNPPAQRNWCLQLSLLWEGPTVPPLLAGWALLARNALVFSAFAIASPFARVSVFQMCASLADQNAQLILLISIYLAVNRRECTYVSHVWQTTQGPVSSFSQNLTSREPSYEFTPKNRLRPKQAFHGSFTLVSRCFTLPSPEGCGLKMQLRPGRCVT